MSEERLFFTIEEAQHDIFVKIFIVTEGSLIFPSAKEKSPNHEISYTINGFLP